MPATASYTLCIITHMHHIYIKALCGVPSTKKKVFFANKQDKSSTQKLEKDVVKSDRLSLFSEFHKGKHDIARLNFTIITLIS